MLCGFADVYIRFHAKHLYQQGTPAAPQTKDFRMGFTGTYGQDNTPLAPGDVVSISKLSCESAPYSEGRFRPGVCASLNPKPLTLNSKRYCESRCICASNMRSIFCA
jgi:hypothetical protein